MSSWQHLYQALLIGCALGSVFGFLRPLRPRWLGDLLFLPALFYGWVYLIFGLCDADPRLAYTLTMILGVGIWCGGPGRWLSPLFSFFWAGVNRFFPFILGPFKKIFGKLRKLENFLFASGKKWVTIKCKLRPPAKAENRRQTHGKAKPLP